MEGEQLVMESTEKAVMRNAAGAIIEFSSMGPDSKETEREQLIPEYCTD